MNVNYKNILLSLSFFSILEASQFSLVSKKEYLLETSPLKFDLVQIKGDYLISSPFANTAELDWAKKFNIVELGNVEDENVDSNLLKNKGLLKIPYHIAYDWMPAFYYYTDGNNRNFVKWMYKNKDEYTLNPKGPFVHCKENHYNWCREYYYNLGNKELFNQRMEDLLSNMRDKKFNGLFFDWASAQYIFNKPYKKVLDTFKKLNPNIEYFNLVKKFYKTLKEKGVFVVTNQGFRQKEFILPFVNYDMTESYITTDKTKKVNIQVLNKGWVKQIKVTNYYPIYKNSTSIKDSLSFIDMLSKYKKEYKKDGFKNFIYLNYIAPEYKRVYETTPLYKEVKPKNAIYFSYAMAKLTNNLVYGEISSNRKLERDDIYFYDLGKPLGKTYEKISSLDTYIRFYEKGFVVASDKYPKELYLKIKSTYLKDNVIILDTYTQEYIKIKNKSMTIRLKFHKDAFTHKTVPLGRVFLYL